MMRSFLRYLVCYFIIGMALQPIQAQNEIRPMTLTEVLERSGASSLHIQIWKQKYQMAVADEKLAAEWWMPTLYAGVQTHFRAGAAMNGDGRFFTDVRRDNMWAGVGFDVEWDLGKGPYERKIAIGKAEVMGLQTLVERQNHILKTVLTYFELQAENQKVFAYNELLLRSDSLIQQLSIQVEGGLAYASDLLLARSKHAHLQFSITESQKNQQNEAHLLRQLLSIREDHLILPSDTFGPVELPREGFFSISFRPEWDQLQIKKAILLDEEAIIGKGQRLPTLKAGAFTSLFGDVVSPLYFTNQLNMAITWDLPLGRVFSQAEKQQLHVKSNMQELQLQALEQDILLEVRQGHNEIISSKTQINFAKESMRLAALALSQSQGRQKLRMAQPFEVFHAREALIIAQMDYIEAVKTHNQAQYKLYVALGNKL